MSDTTMRMYQFLSTQSDWLMIADKNSDGVIVKSEFRSFMEESDFDWQSLDAYDINKSEDVNKKDIINSFWSKLDVKKSGKAINLEGKKTSIKNTNALGKDEIDLMDFKITIYEHVGVFCNNLDAPMEVSNESGWKKSVEEGICNKIETEFIKSGKTLEELENYLEEITPLIQNKATADYCYQEYIAESCEELREKYGYTYGDDKTLKSIIDNYINKHLTADASSSDIQEEVEEIIDAYLATAGEGLGDTSILQEYGYDVESNPKLNYLQETIVKSTIKKNAVEYLQTLTYNGENLYSNYQKTFDTAVENFIKKQLQTANYEDFEILIGLDDSDFAENSELQKACNTVIAEEAFQSIDLYNAIKSKISESFANKIFNVNDDKKHISYKLAKGQFSAYDNIYKNALDKAKKGEFGNLQNDGISQVVEYVTKEIKAHLADFYGKDWGDMPLEELKTTYEILEDSALENNDLKALKNAAIRYCKSASNKNIGLADAITELLGKNFVQYFSELKDSASVQAAMKKVIAKVTEMGDASTFELLDSSWGDLKETIYLEHGSTGEGTQFKLTPAFKNRNVPASRITYDWDNSDIMSISDSGVITLDSSAPNGTYTSTVSILCDGVVVGTKTVTVEVKTAEEIMQIVEEKSKDRSWADKTWCAIYHGCRQFFDHLGLKTVGTVIGAVVGAVGAAVAWVAEGIKNVGKAVWNGIKSIFSGW